MFQNILLLSFHTLDAWHYCVFQKHHITSTILLENYHSGNNVGQDWEFSMTRENDALRNSASKITIITIHSLYGRFSGPEKTNCRQTMSTRTMDRVFTVQIKSNQIKKNKSSTDNDLCINYTTPITNYTISAGYLQCNLTVFKTVIGTKDAMKSI